MENRIDHILCLARIGDEHVQDVGILLNVKHPRSGWVFHLYDNGSVRSVDHTDGLHLPRSLNRTGTTVWIGACYIKTINTRPFRTNTG